MNGETRDEYKVALATSTAENIKPLVEYIMMQKDFIAENKKMF